LARAMMTAARNDANLLPIRGLNSSKIAVVSLGADKGNEFAKYCGMYAPVVEVSAPKGTLTTAQYQEIADADVVIVGVFNDSAETRATFSRLAERKGIVPVFFINKLYNLSKFAPAITKCPTLVLAYDDSPVIRETAAQAIFGGVAMTGRVPVNIKDVAAMGDGVNIAKSRLGYTTAAAAGLGNIQAIIDSIARESIAERAVPGCQILIAKRGDVVVNSSYGYTDFVNHIPVTDETIYDLASVSKATGTLSGIMKAFDEGLIKLDERASTYIPGLRGTDKETLTIRELLYHETGMPPSLNMYDLMMDPSTFSGPIMRSKQDNVYSIKIEDGLYGNSQAKMRRDIFSPAATPELDVEMARGMYVGDVTFDTIMNHIYHAKLAPTKAHVYSCLNFCLLMDAEQNATEVPHEEWVATEVFGPLGMYRVGYRPTEWYSLDKIAPTEQDNYLRRQLVHGYVHDELAAFSGGIQGNAGLFGNANDLAKLMQMWLNGGSYGGEQILSGETVDVFTNSPSKTCRRGLGFDMWTIQPDGTTVNGAPVDTYGHTGFTGTAFWVDPDNDIIFIYLSNRVNPTRNNKAFARLSPRNQMMKALYK
ncbi:MAG: serine hydrolase, partial [Muribaculaceae bacterium]|nr:serine hydrolase [Muribaculaceae bacterium]